MLLLALARHLVDDSGRAGDRKLFQFVESHPCAQLCGRTEEEPEGVEEARAAFNCGLPGFARRQWSEDDDTAQIYIHRLPLQSSHAAEQVAPRDGCPGAWYRSRFAASLRPFLRRRSFDSCLRDRNPRLHPRLDPRLLDALALYESYEDRAYDQMNRARAKA